MPAPMPTRARPRRGALLPAWSALLRRASLACRVPARQRAPCGRVQALRPCLLAHTPRSTPPPLPQACLDTLLSTTFINTIDAPSLALVVPVVHRGLRDRTGETKRKAARIVGSMCTLVNDSKVGPAAAVAAWHGVA